MFEITPGPLRGPMGVFFFVGFALGEIMVALEYMGLKAAGVKDSWRYVKKILKLSGYITFSGWVGGATHMCFTTLET